MFSALRAFQQSEGLKVDGLMRPGGPTEKRLNELLTTNLKPDTDGWKDFEISEQEPPAGEFELAFWKKGGGFGRRKGSDSRCFARYEIESRMCTEAAAKRGPQVGAICRKSAAERYAACRAGRPEPPLLTGDWPVE